MTGATEWVRFLGKLTISKIWISPRFIESNCAVIHSAVTVCVLSQVLSNRFQKKSELKTEEDVNVFYLLSFVLISHFF